jgi:ribosomal protein S6--L-glutamate ligase
MKACILAYRRIRRSKPLYLELMEAMKKRFGSVLFIPIEHVSMNVSNDGIEVKYRNRRLEDFDAILPRIGPSYVPFGYLVLKELEGKVYFPNKPEAYLIASNKFYTLMKLRKAKLPVPKTFLSIERRVAKSICKELRGPSIILKRLGKSGGRGVVFAKDISSAYTIIDALPHARGGQIFIEEYLPNPGEDIRLFVIGKEVAACMRRIAKKDEIRSNIHAGGKGESFTPTKRMQRIAVRAAKAIGADICGVDIIVSNKKPFVIECNMNPGFYISKVTGVNLFDRIAEFVYQNTPKPKFVPMIERFGETFVERIRDLMEIFKDLKKR